MLLLLTPGLNAQQIVNGQIYTPGIAIVDAPQPNTPLGGGRIFLQLFRGWAKLSRLLAGRSRCFLRWTTSTATISE